MQIEGKFRAVAVPVTTDDGELYVQLGTSSQKGTPQVAANFRILEGEHQGTEVMWFGYFSDKVDKGGKTLAERTIESLRAMGFKGNDLGAIESQRLDQEVSITVNMEESQKNPGTFYPRVRFVNRAGGGGVVISRMDDTARKRFAAEMAAKCKSIGEVSTPPPASVPGKAANGKPVATGAADAGGDDVPFS